MVIGKQKLNTYVVGVGEGVCILVVVVLKLKMNLILMPTHICK